jgi:hypothetical protein
MRNTGPQCTFRTACSYFRLSHIFTSSHGKGSCNEEMKEQEEGNTEEVKEK